MAGSNSTLWKLTVFSNKFSSKKCPCFDKILKPSTLWKCIIRLNRLFATKDVYTNVIPIPILWNIIIVQLTVK